MGLLDRLRQVRAEAPRHVKGWMPQSSILPELLHPTRLSQIVDVGANPVDGSPPYAGMLERGLCEVTGFEPQAEALAELEKAQGPRERYLPYALGDGREHTLHVCEGSGMTSLLKPDLRALALFPALLELARVKQETVIATRRLDDVAEIREMDLLKIDVQGAELMVFQSGSKRLAEACAIQTEVSWVGLYEGQPVLSDVDAELRRQGFLPHTVVEHKVWPIAPYVHDDDPLQPVRQMLESDLVYLRDLTRPDLLSQTQLQHMALVAEQCFGSVDVALRCLLILEQRGQAPGDSRRRYTQWMREQGHPAQG